MIRKATETKLKKYWYCLLGKELYVYKNKREEKGEKQTKTQGPRKKLTGPTAQSRQTAHHAPKQRKKVCLFVCMICGN